MLSSKPIVLLVLLAAAFAAAAPAHAGGSCLLDGREYAENLTVCSNGLVLFCANGTWQSDEGRRCDQRSGSYVGPTRPFHEKNDEEIPAFYKEKYPELNLQ